MQGILRACWYRGLKAILRGTLALCWQLRALGRGRVPRRGGVLLASNHQSFLDPVLVAVSMSRPVRFLARESLFRHAGFAWLIRSLGAVPIQREGLGVSGVRACVDLLSRGEVVLVFPEGTRTRDGRVGRMRPGVGAIARRAGVPIVPVTICGAYEVWPRHRSVLGLGSMQVRFGCPVASDAGGDTRELGRQIQRYLVGDLRDLRHRYHRRR